MTRAYCSLIAIIIRKGCLHVSTSEDYYFEFFRDMLSLFVETCWHFTNQLMTWSMATVTWIPECHANPPELTESVMRGVSSGHLFVIRHPHCTEAQEGTCTETIRVLLQHVCALCCHVQLSATPLIITFQAPLSMEFSRQEYWNRLPFPTAGDLLDPAIELVSPAWAGTFFTTASPTVP